FDAGTLARIFEQARAQPKVVAAMSRPIVAPPKWYEYGPQFLNASRIDAGTAFWQANDAALARAQDAFGVPAAVIVAIIGVETYYGRNTGSYRVIDALSTLAFDYPRRADYFSAELRNFLLLCRDQGVSPLVVRGSFAGAMGLPQFMPGSIREYAIDYDGDGRIDLFRDEDDVIGSTANYMHHLGWRPNEPWLEEVRVTGELPWQEADLAIKHPLSKWAGWGITRMEGSPLPTDSNLTASLLLPMGRNGPAFLAYPNFDIYTEWNNSLTYATTAAYLATRIDGASPMSRGRGPISGLDGPQTQELQRILAGRGYDVGKIDGLAGAKTRTAVKDMQLKLGLPADSYPTPELLAAVRGGR
ncbi:MAG: lytic murein transglycosylase B, partial [Hyphomicrobium sp.]